MMELHVDLDIATVKHSFFPSELSEDMSTGRLLDVSFGSVHVHDSFAQTIIENHRR